MITKIAPVYNVDFKKKRLRSITGPYSYGKWTCTICAKEYNHDSRNEFNVRRVKAHNFQICEHCVEEMHEMIFSED